MTRVACQIVFLEQGMAVTNGVALGLCPPGDMGSAPERDAMAPRAGAVGPVPSLRRDASALEFETEAVFYQRLTTVLCMSSGNSRRPTEKGRVRPRRASLSDASIWQQQVLTGACTADALGESRG